MSQVFGGTGPAIVLAGLGALCFAGAAVLQHRAVSAESRPHSGPETDGPLSLRGLRAVTRQPGWLAGLALAASGSVLHAVALVLAPLSVVQPVGVLAVPIAVVLTAVLTRRVPGAGVVIGVAVSIAGVAAFVLTAAGTAVSSPPPDGATLVAGLVVAGIVAALAVVGLSRPGWVRCVACATAAAVAFGLLSALVRAVSQTVSADPSAALDPGMLGAVAGVALAVVAGGWLVQQAFASGPPEVVIACLTVVDPIVAVVLGAVLLGEGAATPPDTWLMLFAAAVTATAGVVALARHHPDAAARSASIGPGAAVRPAGVGAVTHAGSAGTRLVSSRPDHLHRR